MNYDEIKPILVSEEWQGPTVKCKFQSKGQETPMEATAAAIPDQDEITKNAGKSAIKSGILSMVISMVSRLIGRMIGGPGGALASAGSSFAAKAFTNRLNPMEMMGNLSEDKKKEAVVQAFKNISAYYEKDESGEWRFKKH